MMEGMNKKALLLAIAGVIILACVCFGLTRRAAEVKAPTRHGAVPEQATGTTVTPENLAEVERQGYGWAFVPDGEEAETGAPMTKVALTVNNVRRELGRFQGTCSRREDADLLPDEKSAVLCWFAGGGTELGVFEEDGKLVVKQGVVDEGSAEEDGFRGDFRTVLAL